MSALELGPTQQEIYKILEEDGGELRTGQIAEHSDQLSSQSVGRALSRLESRGLVESRDYGDPRGWFLYSIAEDDK